MTQYEFYSTIIDTWVACSIHEAESLQIRGYQVRKREIVQTPYTYLEL